MTSPLKMKIIEKVKVEATATTRTFKGWDTA